MELSRLIRAPEFLDNLVVEPFKLGEESVDITVNIDAFTSEFWRRASAQMKKRYLESVKSGARSQMATGARKPRRKKAAAELKEALNELPQPFEMQALEDETERAIFADLLLTAGINGQSPPLAEWGVKVNGEPIKPSHEVLMSMPTTAVRALWLHCRRTADTVKKQMTRPTSPSPMTGATIGAGSSTSTSKNTSTPESPAL